MNGKIKFFNRLKGFGFVTGENGEDYFISYKSLNKELRKGAIAEDTPVAFEVDTNISEKGPVAINVTLLS